MDLRIYEHLFLCNTDKNEIENFWKLAKNIIVIDKRKKEEHNRNIRENVSVNDNANDNENDAPMCGVIGKRLWKG